MHPQVLLGRPGGGAISRLSASFWFPSQTAPPVSKTDDRGNTTSAGYDSRDRPIFSRTADGALSYTVYDADSMVTQTVDRNGSALNRT